MRSKICTLIVAATFFITHVVYAEATHSYEEVRKLPPGIENYLEGSNTMAAAKKVLEYAGFVCSEEMGKVTGIKGDTYIVIPKGQRKIYINDKYLCIDVENTEKGGVIYTPVKPLTDLLAVGIRYADDKMELAAKKERTLTADDLKDVLPVHIVDTSKELTLEDIGQYTQILYNNYGNIVSFESIGKSYEGRDIHSIRVSTPGSGKKAKVLLMGGIHAREQYSVMLVMQQLNHILYNYYLDGTWGEYNVRDILSQCDIYFIPTINPDGMNIVQNGLEASKNYEYLKTIPDNAGNVRWWKANARGVDLNANFDDGNWQVKFISGLSSTTPSSEGYKGDSPDSEPETQAIERYCRDKKFDMAISYHTAGKVFYWADTDTHELFNSLDTEIIDRMASITGYSPMPVSTNPAVFGSGFENWFKKEFQRFAICVELGPVMSGGFGQYPPEDFNSIIWSSTKYAGIQLALEAVNMREKTYDVYQGGHWLKSFYIYQDAFSYAKLWDHSRIVRSDTLIYEFN